MRVTNSGNTSRDLLSRFDRDVVSLNPDWFSICIGINDVWRQFDCPAMPDTHVLPDEYRENVEKMILSVKDKIKGIFILTPYIMEPNHEGMMRKRMDEYVAICHSSYIAWDRIHPNQVGATLMTREFLKHCEFDYNK